MSRNFRLDAYLARIGFGGPVNPDLATLAGLQAHHVAALPFEALDPLLRRPVALDLDAVQAKIVEGQRGGYCFEQNALLQAALQTIGFKVTGLGARVRWMSPPGSPLGPRTHMLLLVDLPEGRFLADAGFGACLLDAPLALQTGTEQATAMGRFRLTETGGLFTLSAKQPSGWRAAYMFDLVPQLPSDYVLSNWFTSTNPQSPFPNTLIMERLAPDRRYKLMNRRFVTEMREGEVASERMIETAEDLQQVLEEVFGVIPPVPAADIMAVLARASPP